MANYNYVARNSSGESFDGTLAASTAAEVAAELFKQGLVPIAIELVKEKSVSIFKKELFPKKIKTEELIYFCRQLYVLIKAGVPIISAMQRIDSAVQSAELKKVLRSISNDLSAGSSLSEAFAKYPKIFSTIFVSMVRTGEAGGKLEESFDQISKYIGLEEKTQKRVSATLRYPITVLCVLLVGFLIVNFFVIPSFAKMYAQMHQELPQLTLILIATSNFLTQHYVAIFLAVIFIVFLFKHYIHTKSGAMRWGRIKLRIFIFGPIVHKVLLGRFAKIFAMTLHAGVPITQALVLVANTMGYPHIIESLHKMSQGIEEGRTLTEMAIRSQLFSPLVIQMLNIGEESGAIDTLLEEVAEYYEREVDYDLDRLGDLMEPAILSILAVFLLIFAGGTFLPMWNMVSFAPK